MRDSDGKGRTRNSWQWNERCIGECWLVIQWMAMRDGDGKGRTRNSWQWNERCMGECWLVMKWIAMRDSDGKGKHQKFLAVERKMHWGMLACNTVDGDEGR